MEKRKSISALVASIVTEPPSRGIKPVEILISLVKGSFSLFSLQSCAIEKKGKNRQVIKIYRIRANYELKQ
jgi:hypothetical protein